MKLVVHSQLKKLKRVCLVQLNYHGGLHYYFSSPLERKFSNDVNGSLFYKISNKFGIGGKCFARLKSFSQRNWDYTLSDIETFCKWINSSYQLTIGLNYEGLNYFNYDQFDFTVTKAKISFLKRLNRFHAIEFQACHQSIQFDRSALFYEPVSDEILLAENLQQDKNDYFLFQWIYQKHWLVSIEYLYQHNNSNSYGFSYNHHRITCSTAFHLWQDVLFRFFGGWESKVYSEKLDKLILTTLDSEQELNNFVIIDFSKDITKNVSLLFRSSFYQNESPIPGRYYKKHLTSCSFEYRF